jgi:hypothetical protein
MKRLLGIFFFLLTLCLSAHSQAYGDLPPNPIGIVNYTTPGTYVNYSYSFTAPTTGVDYFGLAIRQDPGYWGLGNFDLTKAGSSTNLLLNPNLQYGGTTNTQYGLQAPADWGIWYQSGNGAPPAAGMYYAPGTGWMGTYTGGLGVNTSTAGTWIDGAVGTFDGIYQGVNVIAGTTYTFSFSLNGTDSSTNPSIEIGAYAGACAAGSTPFTCTPSTASGFTAAATPAETQGTGGAPVPVAPTVVSTNTTNATSTLIIGNNQVTVTTPTTTTTYSDGSTTTSVGTPVQTTVSNSAFTGVHFGPNQVADGQWNVNACMNTSTCQVYSTLPGVTYETGSLLTIGATQYITFIPNTGADSSTYPWTMVLVNSDGTFTTLGTGRILVEGVDSSGHIFVFFTNSTLNGTLLSGNLGLTGQGVTFSGTQNPSITATNTLAGGMSATPLAGGQVGGTGGVVAPTVVSTSNTTIITTTTNGATVNTFSQPVIITNWSDGTTTTANNGGATLISSTITGTSSGTTTGQQTDINGFNANPINGSGIYIRQSGSHDVISINQIGTHNLIGGINQQFAIVQDGNNYITIKQGNGNLGKNEIDMSVTGGSNNLYLVQASDPNGISAGDNYQKVNISGFSNTVNTSQTNDGGLQGHFAEIDVTGNYNNINVSQNNNTQKQAFISANGNNNIIQTTQSGTGAHYVSVTTTGDGNSATVNQSGSVANSATIALTNAGAPASVNLIQTGGQSYSVNQTCYTTCGTITVRQGN